MMQGISCERRNYYTPNGLRKSLIHRITRFFVQTFTLKYNSASFPFTRGQYNKIYQQNVILGRECVYVCVWPHIPQLNIWQKVKSIYQPGKGYFECTIHGYHMNLLNSMVFFTNYRIFSILFVLEYLLQFQEGLKYYIKYIILSRHCQMLHWR